MGCCNSLKFEAADVELSLPDPIPRAPVRDPDGFADVSLDSHSDSGDERALETHPVFLMNSVIMQEPLKLVKQRSITVAGHPISGCTLEGSLREATLLSETDMRSNPRSISYYSRAVVVSPVKPVAEVMRSTRASVTSSFHEGHEPVAKVD